MANEKPDVLVLGPAKPTVIDGLAPRFNLHKAGSTKDAEPLLAQLAPRLQALAVSAPPGRIDEKFMTKLPKLAVISSFGVGYDHVDAAWAGQHGVIVTHTPDVLNEEVADTAMGLLLCTVRQLPQADRFLRRGEWVKREFHHTQTLRDRTVGIVGLGRIGKAIARRLEAFGVPIAYYGRNRQPDVSYRYYPDLVALAGAVDTLIVVTPGGPETQNLINSVVLSALGPRGILINISRGSVVDEAALIEALKKRTILAAGLDVFLNEPRPNPAFLELDNATLLPHVGSASQHTRDAMGQLVVDNLLAYLDRQPPKTPVPETPFKGW
jgi:lactate dehydrogenase-like 2-hydroxyacid dehydrogenase